MSQYVVVECKQGCTARLAVMQTQTAPVRALLHMRCSYRPVCSHSQRLQYYKNLYLRVNLSKQQWARQPTALSEHVRKKEYNRQWPFALSLKNVGFLYAFACRTLTLLPCS